MSLLTLASLTLVSVTALAAQQAVAATACAGASPAHTVALVELYTSEGCSSCPPADRWLSRLPNRYASDRLVPLALHVDYWNDLGWQDPYSKAEFAGRQRRLARLSGTGTIYTPGVFAAMRELRGWNDPAAFDRRVQEINRQPARAAISAAVAPIANRKAKIEVVFRVVPAERARQSLQGVIVIFEDRLVSDVHRGENRGVTLHHDRVVRDWSAAPLNSGGEPQRLLKTIDLPPDWNTAHLGVAAFVEDRQSGEVLQALALPGCMPAG